ncbi:putative non-LTR retroelement reverse transcriptase, partial [Trifolium medium]|nr:putative non-LTR retroelement reverse transcriptase [Trifolium medium]
GQRSTALISSGKLVKKKDVAGLGIRDLRLVNVSLLAKWRWKLLSHDYEVWKEVIVAKYGSDVIGKRNIGVVDVPRTAS